MNAGGSVVPTAHPATPLPAAFLAEMRELLGERLTLSPALRAEHGASETHFAPRLPDAVAFPADSAEVAAIVRACSRHRVPLVPFGAGTSIEGHTLPVQGGLSLDLSRMDAIVAVNAEDFDCRVQPGVRREALNAHLRDKGLFFPIDPGANATIGGMAATRASGTNAVRYGTMREAVLSLRVVTPDGREIHTGARARKAANGYDLTRLFVGSEGTLGIITEITLRLHPVPEAILSGICGFDTLEGAVRTVVEAMQCAVPLARVEVLNAAQIRAVNAWSRLTLPERPTLFFEFHGSEAGVAEQVALVAELAQANGGGAFDWSRLPEERSRLWRARHEAYYAAVNQRPGAVGWSTDVCVPISALPEAILAAEADIAGSSVPATILGHVGDGNFHVLFSINPANPGDRLEVERLNDRIVARALAAEGTCSGEHGIGLGKQHCLEQELGEALDLMRAIKRALDPQNLFNPGKIFSLNDMPEGGEP